MRETDVPMRLRRQFGDFVEDEKRATLRGTKNRRGDYTYAELRLMAVEFRKAKGL